MEEVVSDDGNDFKEICCKNYDLMPADYSSSLYPIEFAFEPTKTRFVEVVVEPFDCPEGHSGYGYPAWIFVDEIGIY